MAQLDNGKSKKNEVKKGPNKGGGNG